MTADRPQDADLAEEIDPVVTFARSVIAERYNTSLATQLARQYLAQRDNITGLLALNAEQAARLSVLEAENAELVNARVVLKHCGIAGIFDEFHSVPDALEQMIARLRQLEPPAAVVSPPAGSPPNE
jgi:hypothetical protein